MQPFQPPRAYPQRGAPSSAGDEVEAPTHAHADDGARASEVAGEPGFFRGGAIPQEQQLGTTGPNCLRRDWVAERIGRAGAEASEAAGQGEPGIPISKDATGRFRHSRRAHQEDKTPTRAGAARRQLLDEVDAWYTLRQGMAQPARCP